MPILFCPKLLFSVFLHPHSSNQMRHHPSPESRPFLSSLSSRLAYQQLLYYHVIPYHLYLFTAAVYETLEPIRWRVSSGPSTAVCSRCNSVTNFPIQIVHHIRKRWRWRAHQQTWAFLAPVYLHENYYWNVHLELNVEYNKQYNYVTRYFVLYYGTMIMCIKSGLFV